MIEPGDTNAIIEFGSDVACYVGACSGCELGESTPLNRRTMGYGYRDADIMIIGGDAIDASPGNPGALDLFTIGNEERPRTKFTAIHDIMEDLGIDESLVYSTTAFKCRLPKYTKGERWRPRFYYEEDQIMPCLRRHLSVELELVRPAVVIYYGKVPSQFLHWHFPFIELPLFLAVGEVFKAESPESWPYDEIVLIRSPKHSPIQKKYKNIDKGSNLDGIRKAFEVAKRYIDEELEHHRRPNR
jgi:hypothetical protein